MLAIIQEERTNMEVTSHILESDPDHPHTFHLFHCWKCGQGLFQFSGSIIMSQPGQTFTRLPIVFMCRKCKQRHLINSII